METLHVGIAVHISNPQNWMLAFLLSLTKLSQTYNSEAFFTTKNAHHSAVALRVKYQVEELVPMQIIQMVMVVFVSYTTLAFIDWKQAHLLP